MAAAHDPWRWCGTCHLLSNNLSVRQPFHNDSAAYNPQRANQQNITVGVSFGAERGYLLRGTNGSRAYFPQCNGMVGERDLNLESELETCRCKGVVCGRPSEITSSFQTPGRAIGPWADGCAVLLSQVSVGLLPWECWALCLGMFGSFVCDLSS